MDFINPEVKAVLPEVFLTILEKKMDKRVIE